MLLAQDNGMTLDLITPEWCCMYRKESGGLASNLRSEPTLHYLTLDTLDVRSAAIEMRVLR